MASVRRPAAAKGQSVRKRRPPGSILRELGVAIVSGRYAPGSVLAGEVEASERFAVSRSVYREAVRMLAAKGLVDSRPKTGTKVSPRARWNLLDPDVLSWTFEVDPGLSFIQALFEVRAILEPAAAALAAGRASPADLARMQDALERMRRHGLAAQEGRAADQDFHRAILAGAGNEVLVTLSSAIAAAVGWTTIYKQRRSPLPRDPLPEHEDVWRAIAAGDAPGAHAAMARLVALALADTELSLEREAPRAGFGGG